MWTKYSMLRAALKLHENADISQYGRLIAFLKKESKNHKPKKAQVLEREDIQHLLCSFTIMKEGFSVNVLDICRKYMSQRPKNVSQTRLVLCYRNEKCTVQRIGINRLSKIPSVVADFLKLPETELYTAHSMRRTSGTLLFNAGTDLGML
ncbi:hypothetical protein Zmor_006620 [Zophobas morio]|uniref:Tyr recombinase domain-containing protein n=1 Tax=Zophobas morio TaxID=2755281 RepID=A0AA38J0G5_9CUCU|nr:hypothetical protein Zmor_006620 [Zophobas morio]